MAETRNDLVKRRLCDLPELLNTCRQEVEKPKKTRLKVDGKGMILGRIF